MVAAASGRGDALKIKVAVSVLFTAAALLTPAHATTGYSTSGHEGMGGANQLTGVTVCAIDTQSVDIQYSGAITQAPEPGTLVMAGLATIGLGMTIRKRTRKA